MLSKDEVERIVKRFYPNVIASFSGGLEDYSKYYNETRHIHSPRTRANIFRDHVVDHVKRNFAGINDVTPVEKANGLFYLEISGEQVGVKGAVAMKFKKVNAKLLASNVSTKQADNFNSQLPVCETLQQLDLFGNHIIVQRPEPTHINAAYLPNDLWTDFEGLFITCPDGKYKLAFSLEVDSNNAAAAGVVVDLVPVPSQDMPSKRRVRPKTDKKKEGQVNESNN
jgi:hypothetical protein